MSEPDVVVLGSDLDGLVAAIRLAKLGRSVWVVDAKHEVGGVMAGGSFGERFRHAGAWSDTAQLRPAIVKELKLQDAGLRLVPPGDALASEVDGPGLTWTGDAYTTDREIARRAPKDLEGLERLQRVVEHARPVIEAMVDAAPPRLEGSAPLLPLVKQALSVRRMGSRDMLGLLRIGPSPAEDLIGAYVSIPLLRAAMAAPSLTGAFAGPLAPHSGALWLLYEALTGAHEVEGGPAALVAALHTTAERAGIRFRLGVGVHQIRTERGAVVGLETADGPIDCRTVLSTLGPRRTVLGLFDSEGRAAAGIPERLVQEVRGIRVRGTWAVAHLALGAPPEWRSRPGSSFRRVHIGESPLDLERAIDAARRGEIPERPYLDVRVLPPGFAPAGQHVLTVHVPCVPYHRIGGWDEAARQTLLDRVVATLGVHAPRLPESVLTAAVLTPPDLEAAYHLEGGHPFHGELALDQMWALRPCPSLAGHHTPVRGLWLAGPGTHPGIGLTGASGMTAARLIAAGA